MNCPVAKVQPAGRLIGTTVLPGTQSDKRQNMWRGNRAIRAQPSRSHFTPFYLFLLSFLSLSLISVNKQRSCNDFSTVLRLIFTDTFFVEKLKVLLTAAEAWPSLFCPRSPANGEGGGDYSCKLLGLARANPWKFIMLTNSKKPHSAEEH